jgi:hypothetical protein
MKKRVAKFFESPGGQDSFCVTKRHLAVKKPEGLFFMFSAGSCANYQDLGNAARGRRWRSTFRKVWSLQIVGSFIACFQVSFDLFIIIIEAIVNAGSVTRVG